MKKYIVITSIFEPTEAIMEFAKKEGYSLVVVGDKKSPPDWKYDKTVYLSVEDQDKLGFSVISSLPYNHYCRKMIGYVYAMKQGADIIIDSDDDNIPYKEWEFPSFEGDFKSTKENLGFINIYEYFTKQKIWARGFPLEKITTKNDALNSEKLIVTKNKVGVWQALADEDPDVDAIYRLIDNSPCIFDKKEPIVLGKNTLSPFNSQNTAFTKELFALLYLPTSVTFRFTDILRGYIAQPIMSLYGYTLGFINATVVQKRNEHNYLKDFESEIPFYLNAEKIIDIINKSLNKNEDIYKNIFNVYKSLTEMGITKEDELVTLSNWLEDIKSFNK